MAGEEVLRQGAEGSGALRGEHTCEFRFYAELLPMTRQCGQDFRRCSGCGALYWRGAHTAALETWLARLFSPDREEPT